MPALTTSSTTFRAKDIHRPRCRCDQRRHRLLLSAMSIDVEDADRCRRCRSMSIDVDDVDRCQSTSIDVDRCRRCRHRREQPKPNIDVDVDRCEHTSWVDPPPPCARECDNKQPKLPSKTTSTAIRPPPYAEETVSANHPCSTPTMLIDVDDAA